MNLFVLSFDYHTFSKKDIPDVIQISTFVHFIFVVKLKTSYKRRQHTVIVGQQLPTLLEVFASVCT